MRVCHFGADVEAEVWVVFDVVVAHAYGRNATHGHHLLQQHRLKHRIQALGNILQEDGRPELDGVLDASNEVRLFESMGSKQVRRADHKLTETFTREKSSAQRTL